MNPGIYTDLSNEDYHAETDWWGSSQLKRFLPEWFGPEPKGRGALDFGTALHTMVLGTKETIVPVDAATWLGKAAVSEQAAIVEAGNVPVLAKDIPVLEGMAAAVRRHPEAARLLYEVAGKSEVSIFAESFTELGLVKMKARLDRQILGAVVDVKTTKARPGGDQLARVVIEYGYDLSAAHYLTVCEAAGVSVDEFVLVFVANTEPYPVTVAYLDESFLERGHTLRDLALSRCLSDGLVEPYEGARNVLTLHPPRWAQLDRMEAF